jgi:hypothetical protein
MHIYIIIIIIIIIAQDEKRRELDNELEELINPVDTNGDPFGLTPYLSKSKNINTKNDELIMSSPQTPSVVATFNVPKLNQVSQKDSNSSLAALSPSLNSRNITASSVPSSSFPSPSSNARSYSVSKTVFPVPYPSFPICPHCHTAHTHDPIYLLSSRPLCFYSPPVSPFLNGPGPLAFISAGSLGSLCSHFVKYIFFFLLSL